MLYLKFLWHLFRTTWLGPAASGLAVVGAYVLWPAAGSALLIAALATIGVWAALMLLGVALCWLELEWHDFKGRRK